MIYKIISSGNRTKWLKRRLEEIIIDIRVLEKIIKKNNLTELFGPSSFPEADQFKNLSVVESKGDFTVFINTCYRCFVESIDRYSKSVGKNNYFWEDVKNTYPSLFDVLHKIRVYRHESDHLELNKNINGQYIQFLNEDLEGRTPAQVNDFYFVLQQRILDALLYDIQIEINRVS